MKPNPGPGRLIALEGLDGAGTTTQSELLADWLRRSKGERVHVTREPSRGPIGAQIRSVLSKRLKVDARALAAMFAADRVDHLYHRGEVIERLEAGEWVIMDRYYLSSFAYQALNLTQEELRWLWRLHEPCLVPDMTIFLDVSPAVCLDRIGLNRGFHFELFERQSTLEKVHLQYLNAAQRFRLFGHNIQIVEGEDSTEAVKDIIKERLSVFWDSNRLAPEQYDFLWRQWPALKEIWQSIEKRCELYLLAVRRLPKGNYQLVFAGRGQERYRIMAYLARGGNVKIFPQGPGGGILTKLKEITERPSLWDREETE